MTLSTFLANMAAMMREGHTPGESAWLAADAAHLLSTFPLGAGFLDIHPLWDEANVGRFLAYLCEWGLVTEG